jgi:hypothetical protein
MDYGDAMDRPDDLRPTDRAMLVALAHHQGDSTPLSLDQERLLDGWVDGRLSSIDADGAAELAKRNVFAAERVLERRLISAASEGPGVPVALAERILRASRPPVPVEASRFNLRWLTFRWWQSSGVGALAAAAAAIAVFGFHFWQQQLRPEQTFQIAMVTLEDRSVLAERVRRTRGPQEPSPRTSSGPGYVEDRFRDIDIPTNLLQRAIASASNNKEAVEHSELMNFLRAQNNAYNSHSRVLIDSALADSVSKKSDQRDSTNVRVYDLGDPRAGNIRSKIEPPPEDAHVLFLTVRQ